MAAMTKTQLEDALAAMTARAERAEAAEAALGSPLKADPEDHPDHPEERPNLFGRVIRFEVFGHTIPIYLHTLVAMGVLAGLWAFLHLANIPFFGQKDDGQMSHFYNMIVFASVALAITIVTIYIVTKTAVQNIVLPFFDELVDMASKWRRGEEITMAEAVLAVAWSINSGLRIAGVFLLQALLATPL